MIAAVITASVWWQDLLFGAWNGWSAWFVLIVHIFGGLSTYPVYDVVKNHPWYQFGFLLGLGIFVGGGAGQVNSRRSN